MTNTPQAQSVIKLFSNETTAKTEKKYDSAREVNRNKIFESACTLIASTGLHSLTLTQITQSTEISTEEFTACFDDIEALTDRVAVEINETLSQIKLRAEDYRDPAAQFATFLRYCFRRTRQEPTWGWLLSHYMQANHTLVFEHLNNILESMIEAGLNKGQFTARKDASVYHFIYGGFNQSLRQILNEKTTEVHDTIFTNTALRCLGMANIAAQNRAQRHLI